MTSSSEYNSITRQTEAHVFTAKRVKAQAITFV